MALIGYIGLFLMALTYFEIKPINSIEDIEKNYCWSLKWEDQRNFLFKRSVWMGIKDSFANDKPKLGMIFKGKIVDIGKPAKLNFGELKKIFRKVTFDKLDITGNPDIDQKLTFVNFPFEDFKIKKMNEKHRFEVYGNAFLDVLVSLLGVEKGLNRFLKGKSIYTISDWNISHIEYNGNKLKIFIDNLMIAIKEIKEKQPIKLLTFELKDWEKDNENRTKQIDKVSKALIAIFNDNNIIKENFSNINFRANLKLNPRRLLTSAQVVVPTSNNDMNPIALPKKKPILYNDDFYGIEVESAGNYRVYLFQVDAAGLGYDLWRLKNNENTMTMDEINGSRRIEGKKVFPWDLTGDYIELDEVTGMEEIFVIVASKLIPELNEIEEKMIDTWKSGEIVVASKGKFTLAAKGPKSNVGHGKKKILENDLEKTVEELKRKYGSLLEYRKLSFIHDKEK